MYDIVLRIHSNVDFVIFSVKKPVEYWHSWLLGHIIFGFVAIQINLKLHSICIHHQCRIWQVTPNLILFGHSLE